MKSLLIFATTMLLAMPSFAQSWGLVGGVNFAGGEVESNGFSFEFDREMGFQLGARYLQDFGDFQLRTGGQINQYSTSFNNFGVDAKLTATQLQVPITAQKMLSEMFGIFGGAALSFHMSDDYTVNGTSVDAELSSIFFALELGASLMFNENFAGECFFDYGLNDFAENTTASVYGLQLVYFFK